MARFSRLHIDSLRGFALAAVVWHHATLWMAKAVAEGGFASNEITEVAHQLSLWLAPLRMPLFTILSGWVYAIRPAAWSNGPAFAKGKIRRILVPLFFVSTLQYFQLFWLQDRLPTIRFKGQIIEVAPPDFWQLWFFHFGHLWFLQALLLIFLTVFIIDAMGWMRTRRMWLFWLTIFLVLPWIKTGTSLWSMNKAAFLTVHFFFGVGVFRFKEQLFTKKLFCIASAVFGVAMAAYAMWKLNGFELNRFEARPIMVAAGISGSFLLLALPLKNQLVAWLGTYSYTVYLYHGLGYEVHQLFDFLLAYGKWGHAVWFTLTFLGGLLVPIAIHKAFENVRFVRMPILGKNP